MHTFLTPADFAAERHYYSRVYLTLRSTPEPDVFTAGEVKFISERDTFEMATVGENDQAGSGIALVRRASSITPRSAAEEIQAAIVPLNARTAELESQLNRQAL